MAIRLWQNTGLGDLPPAQTIIPILRYINHSMPNTSSRDCGPCASNRRLSSRLILVLLCGILVSGCSLFKKDEPEIEQTADELYAAAKDAMTKNNWQEAIENLRAVEAKYPYGIHAEQAQLDTVYVYYRSEQSGLAIAAADRFIKLHPAHASVDYAYYLKGLASFDENTTLLGRLMGQDDLSDRDTTSMRNAMTVFNELANLFPDSQYAPDAKRRAGDLLDALARNEIAVANYYYSRGAYVAVVNRARGIIENYSLTPSVEQALALLMFSYENMELDDLAGDSRRVLELNFPNSDYLNQTVADVSFSNPYSPKSDQAKKSGKSIFSDFLKRFRKDRPAS